MAVLDAGQAFVESEGEKFPVAEAGVYEARIVAVVDHASGDSSKHPGTPMWKITFAIEGGNCDGIRVNNFQTLPFGGGTEWMNDGDRRKRIDELKRLWIACGIESEDGVIDSDDLINSQLRIDVGLRGLDSNKKTVSVDSELCEMKVNDIKDVLPLV